MTEDSWSYRFQLFHKGLITRTMEIEESIYSHVSLGFALTGLNHHNEGCTYQLMN